MLRVSDEGEKMVRPGLYVERLRLGREGAMKN